MKDKIYAIRKKSAEIVINMIRNSNREWCDVNLIPKILKFKDEVSYLVRQQLLLIIENTVDSVSPATLADYKKVTAILLADKIPNVKLSALKIIAAKKKLGDKTLEGLVLKLK